MKRVLIHNLKGGEILAQEIFDARGVQWLAKGTTYKESYRNKLGELGIKDLYIQEDITTNNLVVKEDFDPELLVSECKNLVRGQLVRFEKSGSINVFKFEKLVFTIVNEVLKSKNVIENLYHIKKYNKYTYEHSVNVTVIGIMIAREMDLSQFEIYEIAMGCILHDLGKIQISEEIINKPATLTEEEFTKIKEHPLDGYNIVKDNKRVSKNIKEIILTHHEKLDGSGYPLGISGSQISIGARICAVADVFDAMCSERPYKMPVPFAESIRTIKTSMNKQLDMEVCGVLEEVLR